jgi:hypothetical protein
MNCKTITYYVTGIALLEELCQQKVHLNIPALSARAKVSPPSRR